MYFIYYISCIAKHGKKTKANCEELSTVCQCMHADIQSPTIYSYHVGMFQKPDISNGPN